MLFGSIKKTIKVNGMHCAHCSARVQSALTALDGVRSAKVSHETGTAQLSMSRPVDDDVLKKAVEDAGFEFAGTAE